MKNQNQIIKNDDEINKIINSSSPQGKVFLREILDKTIPKEIILEKINMLNEKNMPSLISLLVINNIFKSIFLSETAIIENMISTGVYKTDIGKSTLLDIIVNNDQFSKNINENQSNNSNRKIFISLIKKTINKDNDYENDEYEKYIKENKLFDLFNNNSLGTQIQIIKLFKDEWASKLIKTNNENMTLEKDELINDLINCKLIRNHLAHNYFILNHESYLDIYDSVINNEKLNNQKIKKQPFIRIIELQKSEKEKINYLFISLIKMLKKLNRPVNFKKIINKRIIIFNNENEELKIDLKNINCILIDSFND